MTQMDWENFSNMIVELTNGKGVCKFLIRCITLGKDERIRSLACKDQRK